MKKMLFAIVMVFSISAGAVELAVTAVKTLKRVTPGTITLKDENGWLYSKNELAHLSRGPLAQSAVERNSAAGRNKNPIPAIVKFNEALKALNIKLIVVPVPPKSAFYPFTGIERDAAMKYLLPFYNELRTSGVTVLDLSNAFRKSDKRVYCKTDAHWSPEGIMIAVKQLAEIIPERGTEKYKINISDVKISGDLAKSLNPSAPEQEIIKMYTVSGKTFDENSPVLLLGDSHTLIFSSGDDMLASDSGLGELLASELRLPVDRIGVKGSAATTVRINLFRKAVKSPEWLKNKKYIIYCFSCREFTETSGGWRVVPVQR